MLADLTLQTEGLDVVLAAKQAELDVSKLAVIDQSLDEALHLKALMRATEAVPVVDVYDRWALNAVVSRIQTARRALQINIGQINIGQMNAGPDGKGYESWADNMQPALRRAGAAIEEILEGGDIGLSKLIVAVGQVDELIR